MSLTRSGPKSWNSPYRDNYAFGHQTAEGRTPHYRYQPTSSLQPPEHQRIISLPQCYRKLAQFYLDHPYNLLLLCLTLPRRSQMEQLKVWPSDLERLVSRYHVDGTIAIQTGNDVVLGTKMGTGSHSTP